MLMLIGSCKVSIKILQKCTICKIFQDESELNRLKRKKNEEARLAKSCKHCYLKM